MDYHILFIQPLPQIKYHSYIHFADEDTEAEK